MNLVKRSRISFFYWRNEIQGLESAVERSADGFDAGAKYHVPANVPYVRYFIGLFYQFQFYKALCTLSGHTGQLNECDFYNSDKLGAFK